MKYKDLNCLKLDTSSSKYSGYNERTATLLHYRVKTLYKKFKWRGEKKGWSAGFHKTAQDLKMVLFYYQFTDILNC